MSKKIKQIMIKDFGVVKQVKTALMVENRLATFIGFLLGGFVPLASYVTAHQNMSSNSAKFFGFTMVGGGLVYSAKTVFEWARMAFSSIWKSIGFIILLEGIMTVSTTTWLGITALCYLILINGTATGCKLSVKS